MKVPFTLESWLKDKSQKIETVDGHSVRIVSTDVKSAERPDRILALVMGDGGYENAIYYNTDGYCLSDSTISSTHRKKDLVIVTPEPEFTPFEHAFDSALRDYCCDDEKVNSYQEWIKKKAEKLMKIAKKELFTEGVGHYFFNDGHTYFCGAPAMEVKEEPVEKTELTEFEQNVRSIITKHLTTYQKDGNGREMSSTVFIDDDTAKKLAADLAKEHDAYLTRKPKDWDEADDRMSHPLFVEGFELGRKVEGVLRQESQVTTKELAAGQVLKKSTKKISTEAD